MAVGQSVGGICSMLCAANVAMSYETSLHKGVVSKLLPMLLLPQ